MTADGLSQLYENCLALHEEYQRSGQIAAQKKLLFHIDNITREKKLLDLGIDTFVYKSDVDDFIHMVDNKVVKLWSWRIISGGFRKKSFGKSSVARAFSIRCM